MAQQTLRDLDGLIEAALIKAEARPALEAVARRYAIAVTPQIAELIEEADDPIARQFLPDGAESLSHPEESTDPTGDFLHMPVDGVVHRYRDRVLLKPVHVCPVYCRFCFRREQVGPGGEALDEAALDRALAYIAAHNEIFEVILTGGDPLMLSARRLKTLIGRLSEIPHLGVLRIHTRVPIADSRRIDDDMVRALATGKALYVSIHCNHPRELTGAARASFGRLIAAGIPLLSQTVLLKGVNDDVETLAQLFRSLYAARVKPYYLHHPDPAPGTAHFRLPLAEGRALVQALWGRIPGPARPIYVLDPPGGTGKVPI